MEKKIIKNLPIYMNLNNNEFITKKDIVADFPKNFGIDKDSCKNIEYATTSGTTSNRMEIIRKKNWWIDEYKRTYKNNPLLQQYIDNNYKKAIFTTAQCSNLICFMDKLPYEKRIINNTLYVNSTFNPWTWTKEDIIQITRELNMFKPYYLDADPVYLAIYLILYKHFQIEEELYIPKLITLSYEYVNSNIKDFIKNTYKTTVLNLYGTTEFGYIFIEDTDGKMRICPALVDVRFEPIDKEKNIYTLIIDSYKNEYMPLINYKVGDLIEMTEEQLRDFKTEGKISRMAGREKDYEKIKIPITYIDDLFKKYPNVLIYQLQFVSRNKMIVKYETDDLNELSVDEQENIRKEILKLNIGNVEIKHYKAISPERSGKFAIVKFWEE